MPPGPWETSEW